MDSELGRPVNLDAPTSAKHLGNMASYKKAKESNSSPTWRDLRGHLYSLPKPNPEPLGENLTHPPAHLIQQENRSNGQGTPQEEEMQQLQAPQESCTREEDAKEEEDDTGKVANKKHQGELPIGPNSKKRKGVTSHPQHATLPLQPPRDPQQPIGTSHPLNYSTSLQNTQQGNRKDTLQPKTKATKKNTNEKRTDTPLHNPNGPKPKPRKATLLTRTFFQIRDWLCPAPQATSNTCKTTTTNVTLAHTTPTPPELPLTTAHTLEPTKDPPPPSPTNKDPRTHSPKPPLKKKGFNFRQRTTKPEDKNLKTNQAPHSTSVPQPLSQHNTTTNPPNHNYTEGERETLRPQEQNTSTTLMTLNARGLLHNAHIIRNALTAHHPQLLTLTETKLRPKYHRCKTIQDILKNYEYMATSQPTTMHRDPNHKGRRAGVLIAIHKDHTYGKPLQQVTTPTSLQGYLLHILTHNAKNTRAHIIGVYAPEDVSIRADIYSYIKEVQNKATPWITF